MDDKDNESQEARNQYRVRRSLLTVLDRIKRSRSKTELPVSAFSEALNAVGERFIDCLLGSPRTGKWWLAPDEQWHECTIRRLGERREARTFLPADHPSWQTWFPKTATRLADALTGPDHLVSAEIPSLNQTVTVVLEQKLRLSTRQNAIATGRTYFAHLRAKPLKYQDLKKADHANLDKYCAGLLDAIRLLLTPVQKGAAFFYSGKVPHVVYASILTEPNLIHVSDVKDGMITCRDAGFLAPIIDRTHFTSDNPYARIVRRSAVHLWVGLDDLLKCCGDEEVEAAWNSTLTWLTETICNPLWRTKTSGK